MTVTITGDGVWWFLSIGSVCCTLVFLVLFNEIRREPK